MADDGFLSLLALFRVPILVVWHTTFAVVSVAWHFPKAQCKWLWTLAMCLVKLGWRF